jgi:hypothetical protein
MQCLHPSRNCYPTNTHTFVPHTRTHSFELSHTSIGSFPLPEKEDYIGIGDGLRIRQRSTPRSLIIPVNVTVGNAGAVLVTLKPERSVPPYRVLNRCRDVHVRIKQLGLDRSK